MAKVLDTRPVFNAVTLTGSYVTQSLATHGTADWIDLKNVDQVVLDVAYTMGAAETANSIQIKVEFANPATKTTPATTDWHQMIQETISGGTDTVAFLEYSFTAVSAAATYDRFQIPFPVSSKFMRVSVKETGIAANGGTVTMKATLSSQESYD